MAIRRLLPTICLAVLAVVVTPRAALAVSQPPVYPITCQLSGQTCVTPLSYHGGTIQHHPRIYIIYWGSGWNSDPNRTTIEQDIKSMFAILPNTALNHILTQYNDNGGDYVHSDVTVPGTWEDFASPLSGSIPAIDAVNEINQAIKVKGWTNTPDTQFMLFPQAGAYGEPLPGSNGECGHHEYDRLTQTSSVVFSFVDYPVTGSPIGCTPTSVPLQMTRYAFHEYAEAATNPHLGFLASGDGWFTNQGIANADLQEVADLCLGVNGPYKVWPQVNTGPGQPGYTVNGMYQIQALYSNAVHGCTYWQGEDGFVPDGAPVHTVFPPMQAVYDADAWDYSNTARVAPWGYPTEEQHPVSGGLRQAYSNGAMYSSSGGVHEVHGAIYARYKALGDTGSFLGWPTSNEQYTPGLGGRENTFQNNTCGAGSAILWTSGPAYEMHGCIYRDYLNKYGGPQGKFGFPASNEQETISGDGRVNYMTGTACGSTQHGSALYWDGSTYGVGGCFFQVYKAQTPPETASALGYPVSDEYHPTSTTTRQDFQRGYLFLDSSGVHVVLYGARFAPTVTVLASNTPACPGTQQYFTTTDYSGVPIDWTYANGSNQCIQVSYSPTLTSSSCTYSFYVPNGYATGVINFTAGFLLNGLPHYLTYSLDENPVTGYQQAFSLANVFSVTFGDNNGQSYPTQLGWGSGVDHGLLQTC